jgi:hypothetical protein
MLLPENKPGTVNGIDQEEKEVLVEDTSLTFRDHDVDATDLGRRICSSTSVRQKVQDVEQPAWKQ